MNMNGGKEARKFLFHRCKEVGYDSDICASGVEADMSNTRVVCTEYADRCCTHPGFKKDFFLLHLHT